LNLLGLYIASLSIVTFGVMLLHGLSARANIFFCFFNFYPGTLDLICFRSLKVWSLTR